MARYPTDQRIVHPSHIPFGKPDSAAKYGRHAGDDSANAAGTPVYAPASGTVTGYTWGTYHGNVVEIFDGKTYPHVFHMSRIVVSPGQRVIEGDLVGYSGATGQGITGAHIHFGVSKVSVPNTRSFDDYIDPLEYVRSGQTALQPYQRRVGSAGVNQRRAPNRSGDIVREWDAGEILDFKGFVYGENINGNAVWYSAKYTPGTYCWSGSFDDTSTNGLPDLTPAPTPPAPPAPTFSARPAGAASWGIDISSHQGDIDFTQLEQAGLDFAIIKAGHTGPSYGGNEYREDGKFERNVLGCLTAGLEIGVYWYCYFDEDPETEAERFAKAAVGYPGSLWADVEERDGASSDWLRRFVDRVEELTERRCHIYTYFDYLNTNPWLRQMLMGRALWLAHYTYEPGGTWTDTPVAIHQYTSSGSLQGINGRVDLNYGYISRSDFKKLGERIVISQPSTPVEPETPTPTPLPPIEPVPVKPGWKTSEFYAALLVVLPIILKLFGVTISPDETVQLVELVTAAALGIAGVLGYILSRSRTKTEAIKVVEKANN